MLKSHLRNNREPVSPINTFAGCKLNIKKPSTEPITMLPNIEISVKLYCIPIIVKQVIIIAETLDESPSIPSVKLTAFVVAKITIMANGIYKNIGKSTYIFKNGIYVSVPILQNFIINNVYATDIKSKPNIL